MQKQDPSAVVENVINGKTAFRLYDTFGFPIEITKEMAEERGFTVDIEGYNEAFRAHQELARTASAGAFKGGLASSHKVLLVTSRKAKVEETFKRHGNGIKNFVKQIIRFLKASPKTAEIYFDSSHRAYPYH